MLLSSQARRGLQVRVLTNSLMANDVPLVHAGYGDTAKPCCATASACTSCAPATPDPDRELLGSSGASLHTKAFVVDGQRGFVGSFQLRSALGPPQHRDGRGVR